MASLRRSELVDALLDEYDSTTLWDEYGIDADIIPFTCDFPRADIHELISSDLLHQTIKGTFKDHLVDWVGTYLEITYDKAEAERIMDEIDRRYVSSCYIFKFTLTDIKVYNSGLQLRQHFLSCDVSSKADGLSNGPETILRH